MFPHGDKTSIGVGSAEKTFSAPASVAQLRSKVGLSEAATVRREGAHVVIKDADPLRGQAERRQRAGAFFFQDVLGHPFGYGGLAARKDDVMHLVAFLDKP